MVVESEAAAAVLVVSAAAAALVVSVGGGGEVGTASCLVLREALTEGGPGVMGQTSDSLSSSLPCGQRKKKKRRAKGW